MNNHDPLVLSRHPQSIPTPQMVQQTLFKALYQKYGEFFIDGLEVDSCDAENLIMHTESVSQYEIISSQILPDIAQIIEHIYGITPLISIATDMP